VGDTGDGDARYWAFISYSHKDAAFGRRLHRRLEGYAIPRRLVGQPASWGTVPRKLAPIFRDRDELSAAHDLTMEVRAALKASRSLIVICSPAAAASQWVAREVEVFRELHPDRPVLTVIREGEPSDCFPALLRQTGPDGGLVEPLAADFRSERDGERLGLLKLVAGVLGINLDALIQRDAHRRMQRVTAVTAGALAAMLAMAVLTLFAVNARREAERQRGQAEGLVEYMLTDLRDKLKGVGRLDVMTAVNERALHYYAGQDLDTLPVDSLERRARVLHAMGEDDETRGQYDRALAMFREAERITAKLLAEVPGDPERIYNQAQSEYWIGLSDYDGERFAASKPAFLSYKALADRLVAIDPENSKYRLEAGLANSNLCSVALKKPRDPIAAMRYCGDSLHQTEQASRHMKPSDEIADLLTDRHAWFADAYRANNDFVHARAEREAEEHILDKRMASDPKNMDLKDTWIALQRGFAKLDVHDGNIAAARSRLEQALKVVDECIKFDPSNNEWKKSRERIEKDLKELPEQQPIKGETK